MVGFFVYENMMWPKHYLKNIFYIKLVITDILKLTTNPLRRVF